MTKKRDDKKWKERDYYKEVGKELEEIARKKPDYLLGCDEPDYVYNPERKEKVSK